MENNDRPGRIERAALDAKDYAMWSLDRFRLSLIDNLSTFVSTLFSVFVLIVLAGIGAMFFAAAIAIILALCIGFLFARNLDARRHTDYGRPVRPVGPDRVRQEKEADSESNRPDVQPDDVRSGR